MNKFGVLIGNNLQFDNLGRLFGNSDNFHNVNGKFSKNGASQENKKGFTLFVLNIYYILITKGIDGVRIVFWNNELFKKHKKDTLQI